MRGEARKRVKELESKIVRDRVRGAKRKRVTALIQRWWSLYMTQKTEYY